MPENNGIASVAADSAQLMEEQGIRILLIEDAPADKRLLQLWLEEANNTGFELTTVKRLGDAIEVLGEESFDVILLDLSLPDSHGLKTLKKLQARVPSLPIIVLSGLDDESMAVRAVKEGAQDYLVKITVDSNLLVRSIKYAIERQRLHLELAEANEGLKRLKQIADICANCTHGLQDVSFWNELEVFLDSHGKKVVDQGVCQSCYDKYLGMKTDQYLINRAKRSG